jgi:hypothetical protein
MCRLMVKLDAKTPAVLGLSLRMERVGRVVYIHICSHVPSYATDYTNPHYRS